jgi:hypothetical protein
VALRKSYAEPPRLCPRQDLNLQPLPCEGSALSVELRGHNGKIERNILVRGNEIFSVDNIFDPYFDVNIFIPCEGSEKVSLAC